MKITHPPIATRDEWLTRRKELLADEKALTRQYDAINARRRRLPMVELEKTYEFDGPDGKATLADLFAGRRQLIVYHFMFDPDWDKGCPGCTSLVDAMGDLSMLADRDTTLVLIARAPLEKLETYRKERGWTFPWYSSYGSDFNYDFHATFDESVAPLQNNFLNREELTQKLGREPNFTKGETHGLSVFFTVDGKVFHTYSTYARGVESLVDAYRLLDCTPYGRQQDFEDSPAGWPQRPTYG